MEETTICCCGSSGWTLTIGGIQVVGAAFSIIVLLWAPLLADMESSTYFVVHLIFYILVIIMGVAVIRGSRNRDTCLLLLWRTFTIICMVLSALGAGFLALSTSSPAIHRIMYLVVGLVIQGFFLWVVGVHMKEIEASTVAELPDDV